MTVILGIQHLRRNHKSADFQVDSVESLLTGVRRNDYLKKVLRV